MDTNEEEDPLIASVLTKKEVGVTRRGRYVPLEIISVLHFIPMMAMMPIQQFYVIDNIARKYGQHTSADAEINYCPNSTASFNNTEDRVQKESANVLMYLGFFSTFLSVIPILLMGAIADMFGRKPTLILAMFGMLLKEVVLIITVYKGLTLWVLVLGEFFFGITGNFGAALAALIGMVADVTKPGKPRAFRITVLEGSVAITLALSTVGIGFWIKDGNYRHPLIFCIACTILSILLTIFILPETSKSCKRANRPARFREMLGACCRLYKNESGKRRKLLVIGQVIFCINVASVTGKTNVQTLFLLHTPLCWTELHVQIFTCIQILVNWGSIILGIRILHRCMHDYGIIVIALVSAVAGSVTFAFGQKDWIVYLYVLVCTMGNATSPLIRSLLSRLVSADEQGSLFASIGSMELLSTSLAQLLYGEVYQLTLTFMPGLVFLVMAGLLFVAFCLSLLVYSWMAKEPGSQTETVVDVS